MGEFTVVPDISVVVPVFNEEAGLEEMLDRLLGQTLSAIEVILADGRSSDRTREIIVTRAGRDPRVRLVDNPGRIQAAGLNRALAAARAPVIARLDGHCFVRPDYLERCMALLASSGADVVGGRMVARPGASPVALGIAVAMNRRWGAGPARFHHDGEPSFVDTVYLGTFRRAVLDRVGGWSEDVGVNEDFDLNDRVRRAGGTIWYDPALAVEYQPRETLRALARQYFRYGRSKATVARKRPQSLLPRQAAPAALVPVGVVALAGPGRRRARFAVAAYAAVLAIVAEREKALPRGTRRRAGLAACVMHWTWSAGFWWGMARPFRAPPVGGQ